MKGIRTSLDKLKIIVKKMPGVIPAANINEFHGTMHKIDKVLYAFDRIVYSLNLLETSKAYGRTAKNLEKKLGKHFKEITRMRKDLEELFFGQV